MWHFQMIIGISTNEPNSRGRSRVSSEKWPDVKQKHAIHESHEAANKFFPFGESFLSSQLPQKLCSTPEAALDKGRKHRRQAWLRFAAAANHRRRKAWNRH